MGAAHEQNTSDGWKPLAFALQFLNSKEERCSVNELELLGIVWSIDYFKYYLYVKNFTVITDNRAILSILKEHRSNNLTIVGSLDGLTDYFHKISELNTCWEKKWVWWITYPETHSQKLKKFPHRTNISY